MCDDEIFTFESFINFVNLKNILRTFFEIFTELWYFRQKY